MSKEFREIKYEKMEGPKAVEGPHYPMLYLSLEHLPEAENWKNGETYEITLRVKQRSITKSEDEKGKSGSFNFDIVAVKTEGQARNPDKEKEEKGEGSYRDRS
jgi:hypothetical protein